MFGDLCGDDLVSSKTIIFYSEAVGLHAQPIKACQKFPHKRKAILFQASPYTCNFVKMAVFGTRDSIYE